jgi:Uma2 family endonuclease
MLKCVLDPELLKPERIVPRAGLLSRRAYETFLAHGMFDEGRLELLRGQLVTMSPRGELHATVTAWIAQRLIRALDETYEVRSNSAFAAADDSEPESDISVSRRQRRRAYHPKKALLLIEVAERSLEKDRWIKSAIYAENGAPEYWVVDLRTTSVFVHTHPTKGVYDLVVQLHRKDVLRPAHLPEIELRIADMFAAR